MSRSRRILLIALLLSSVIMPVSVTAQEGDDSPYAPLLDELEAETAQKLGDTLSAYQVEAELTPADDGRLATIEGALRLAFVNATDGPVTELPFRLYPNNAEYGDGDLSVEDITVDGAPVEGELDVDDTLLTVPLEDELAVDDGVTVELSFTTTLPTDPRRSYGMFQYDSDSNTYSLAHWLPLLAGWTEADGWKTGELSENGDPVFTNTATFDVTLTAPSDLTVVTSGISVGEESTGDITTRSFLSGPSRDFVMAASEDFTVVSTEVDGTVVNSYALPGLERGSEDVLVYTAQSLVVFNELLGPYPYEEIDMVAVPLGNGAAGVEFPGIMYVGADYYSSTDPPGSVPGFLEFVVAHEVGHQWFYAVVGNDQYEHAYIDEGLVSYLTAAYFGEQYGEETGLQQVDVSLKLPYFSVLFQGGDAIVAQPTDDFRNNTEYGAIVYGKGALAFYELRQLIGDEAFFRALRAYYEEFAYGVATPEDLQAAFEAASGEDLDEFWRHWFLAAEGDQDYDTDDLEDLIEELDL